MEIYKKKKKFEFKAKSRGFENEVRVSLELGFDPGLLEILVSISSGRSPVSRMFASWKRKFDLDLKLGDIYIYIFRSRAHLSLSYLYGSSIVETALKLGSRQLVNTILIDTILQSGISSIL